MSPDMPFLRERARGPVRGIDDYRVLTEIKSR
jgi:hypothetical protein